MERPAAQYPGGMTIRPYQLVCAVCTLGADPSRAPDARCREILDRIRESPDMPLTLRCNAGDVFAYQDPGPAEDSPGSPEFNMSRDLEILYRLNLAPGCTLPARILFNRLLDTVETVEGICRYRAVTSEAWAGCPRAASGEYERGRARGIQAIITPRSAEAMRQDKAASLAAMNAADAVRVRPHILVCSVCQYGAGTRPPYPEDNLPELLERILEKPDLQITLARGADWMMCGPCPYRKDDLNACVNNKGAGGLPNQMRDLRVLQKLGLVYGSTLAAGALYRLLLERITGTLELCRIDHARPSIWWTGCGSATVDSENYRKGRELLMARMGISPSGSGS